MKQITQFFLEGESPTLTLMWFYGVYQGGTENEGLTLKQKVEFIDSRTIELRRSLIHSAHLQRMLLIKRRHIR